MTLLSCGWRDKRHLSRHRGLRRSWHGSRHRSQKSYWSSFGLHMRLGRGGRLSGFRWLLISGGRFNASAQGIRWGCRTLFFFLLANREKQDVLICPYGYMRSEVPICITYELSTCSFRPCLVFARQFELTAGGCFMTGILDGPCYEISRHLSPLNLLCQWWLRLRCCRRLSGAWGKRLGEL